MNFCIFSNYVVSPNIGTDCYVVYLMDVEAQGSDYYLSVLQRNLCFIFLQLFVCLDIYFIISVI